MWLIIVLFSLVFLAGIEIFYKLYIDRNPNISTFAGSIPSNVFMLMWALPFFLFAQAPLIQAQIPWSLLVATNLFYIAGVVLYYESYKVLSASIATILGMSSVLATTTIGILLLGESVTLQKFIGIGLVILAIVILNFEKSNPKIKGYLLAFLGGIMYGIGASVDKFVIADYMMNVDHFNFLSVAVMLPMKLLIRPKTTLSQVKKIKPWSLIFAAAAAFCIILGYKFTYTAYSLGGEVAKVDAINNLSIFVIIAAEILFLKDKSNLRKKLLSAGIAVTGVLLLR